MSEGNFGAEKAYSLVTPFKPLVVEREAINHDPFMLIMRAAQRVKCMYWTSQMCNLFMRKAKLNGLGLAKGRKCILHSQYKRVHCLKRLLAVSH